MFIWVYQMDAVLFGKAHALFAVYSTKAAKDAGIPPMYSDEIDFTYNSASSDSMTVQAENAIKLRNGYSSCNNV